MSFEVEYFTLTPTDSTNEYISLGGTPVVTDNVALDLIGGTAQALSGDFVVDSTSVRWDSTVYNLNGQLVTGDKLRVIYDKS
jgi:hypothetical protein